ncbi:ApaG domain-containing protein [bacterium]|nr:ApaG domain-containing protein [bacterium]
MSSLSSVELPSECVERILWYLSRSTDGDPKVIRESARISKTWKRAADTGATYAAMLLHRFGIDDLSVPFTRDRVDWGPDATLNRVPDRTHAPFDPSKIADATAETFSRSDIDFEAFDYRTPTDLWTEDEIRAELKKLNPNAGIAEFTESRTERFVPSPRSAKAMLKRRNKKAANAKGCFHEWFSDFGDVEPSLFRKTNDAWRVVENTFATQGMSSVLSTILPGETKARCDTFAAYFRDFNAPTKPMHPSLALMYRLRGGQMTFSPHAVMCGAGGVRFTHPDAFDASSCRLGVFGGLSVYDDNRCTSMLSFDHAVVWVRWLMLHHEEADTDAMPGQIAYTQMAEAFRLVPFAGSWHDALHNSLCVDVERGTIHAHVPPLGGAAPDYPWKPENAAVPGDVCEWFTEYARRVEAGVYRVAHDVEPFRLADMDPHASPDMVLSGPMMWRMPRVTGKTSISYEDRLYEHTSFGALRVTVGVAYTGIQPIDAPHYFNGPVHGQSIYAYEVSFTLLSEEEQRTAWEKGDSSIFGSSSSFQPIREARLKSRRWECEEVVYARARDRETDESFNHGDLDREIWSEPEIVEGEGVIGLTPTLTAGGDTFRYRSMTTVSRHPSHRVLAPLHEINKDCTWGVSLSGVMSGGFTFVAIPEGAREVEFVAQCPAFMCEAPQYVFG